MNGSILSPNATKLESTRAIPTLIVTSYNLGEIDIFFDGISFYAYA